MAIILVQADPNDGTLEAGAWKHDGGLDNNLDFEEDARRGTGAGLEGGNVPETGQRLKIGGQKWNGGTQTNRYESFVNFTPARGFILPSGGGLQEVVTASLRVSRKSIVYTNPNDTFFGAKDSMAIWNVDWSGDLSGSNWFDLMAISGAGVGTNYQPEAEMAGWAEDKTGSGVLYEGGGEAFWKKVRDHLAADSAIGHVLLSWTSTQGYPADKIWVVNIVSANDVLTSEKYHPKLITRTQRKHALNSVGGASIQMTDGTAVFLRYDPITGRYNLYYQRVNQTSPTLIDYVRGKVDAFDNSGGEASYYGYEPGFQSYSLTRDSNENLYVVGPRGNPQTGTYGQKVGNANCWKYNGSYTWSRFTATTFGENALSDTDTHRGFINSTQAVWVPQGTSPSGQLCVLHSRRDGQWGRYQTGVYGMSAEWLRGAAAKSPSVAYAGDDAAVSSWWRSFNSSGSHLDGFRDENTIYMAGAISAAPTDEDERSAGMVCQVASNGVVSKPSILSATISNLPHDPDGKIRALWLGDSSPYWAIVRAGHIQIVRKSDGGIQRQIDIPATGAPGFPSTATLQKSQAWDAAWDAGDPNYIWIYHRSSSNPRHIQKTRYDFVNGALSSGFTWTPDPLGASGSEIVAIRVPRQQVDTRCVIVDVAMQDGAGNPINLISLRDISMNKAPDKPVLLEIGSFDASGLKTVDWTFFDRNPSDFATFQDVEIRNVLTGATSYSQLHVAAPASFPASRIYRATINAGSLVNDTAYEMRVRAYDSVDFPSEWSDWRGFSTTSTGGIVKIISPATDNEPLNRSTIEIFWNYTNTSPSIVQTGYRVRVFNRSTGVSVYDSNLVVSTATSHTITDLTSDIEYRVEVTIKDSNGQMSGAGSRLITPDFNNPSLPEIVVISQEACVEIRVTNPPPTGDNPVTIKNQIARKEATASPDAYVVIGECPPNGVYQDWAVASGVEYTYKARGSSE